MVSVIPELSSVSPDTKSALIVLTSDKPEFPRAIEELKDSEVIGKAQAFATQHGMRDPRANRANGAPYAVNDKGENIMELMNKGIPAGRPETQVHAYRVAIKLIAPPL